ncbi:GDSL-type esterase/lipase family protein [Sphingomonas sp. LB-2]|uniref:SGNH/GDSL hydrolase family protein n=1 Tax=Sphingomonas caeni TaxID=2984949 RepID=UPI00222F0F1E|nr:GDSL-type esterase/lipase family protein [Sphingomonas caeni]MCW3848867.1 GDSL-type esterase/lipase family protein [Sphingomonas caeni]
MKLPNIFLDRTTVLLLGVGVGSAIGFSFLGGAGPASSAPPPSYAVSKADSGVTEIVEALQPAQRQLLETLKEGRPVRIAVFGDSFGDGVAFGLQQQLTGKAGYEVLKFSQPATGFTRYKRLNLEDRASEQLGSDPIDIAVISFGANDAQGIITDKGEYAALLSPKWCDQIGKRIDRFVALLRAHNAMVYWVGLPRMRDGTLDRDVMGINLFYAQRMAALGVPFIDTRPVASDAKGQFADYLPDPVTGARTLVREGDGIHMSMTGYKWITRSLSDRIRRYVDAGRKLYANSASAARR